MIIIYGPQGTGKSRIAYNLAYMNYKIVDLGEHDMICDSNSKDDIDKDSIVVCQKLKHLSQEHREQADYILRAEKTGDGDA